MTRRRIRRKFFFLPVPVSGVPASSCTSGSPEEYAMEEGGNEPPSEEEIFLCRFAACSLSCLLGTHQGRQSSSISCISCGLLLPAPLTPQSTTSQHLPPDSSAVTTWRAHLAACDGPAPSTS
jgi:hypothetical protein